MFTALIDASHEANAITEIEYIPGAPITLVD